jgi:hypothetical protein
VRLLLVPLLIALALVAAADLLIASRAPRHFLPEQKMAAAVAAGPDCLLLLGDSRMDAAYSPAALHEALRRRASDRCVADLSIGATDISGIYLSAREYLSRGGRPQLVVIGKVADSLLDPSPTPDPQQMVGNNAIQLIWSRPSDVFVEYPGFPVASVGAFDSGFRFLIARATAIGRYQSLFWVRVQRAQDLLVGAPAQTHNRFGAVADMGQLEGDLRGKALGTMARSAALPAQLGLGRWFTRLVALLADARIPFVLVELPMPSAYRRAVSETPEALAYQRWLLGQIGAFNGTLIDLGQPPWIDDAYFADPLHLNQAGAQKLSSDLGERL